MTEPARAIGPVGLIGVGVMGRCMVDCLLAAGFSVVAFDPAPAAQEFVRARAATLAPGAPAVAEQCRLIVTSLPANRHVLDVVAAIAPHLTPEHVVVDTSTVSPDTSRQAAQIAAEYGARYIDAPILGRPSAAGKWLLPAGGPPEALAWARPALETFARAAVWVGDTGSGNTLKLLNQLMFSVINGISSEVMAVASGLGVDLRTFYDTVANSGAATVSGLFKETGGRIAERRFDNPVFTVELLSRRGAMKLALEYGPGFMEADFGDTSVDVFIPGETYPTRPTSRSTRWRRRRSVHPQPGRHAPDL
jgi:3-hydroxyisobutyrate dehydrogenase-like beta-hydroxyacid dehydrogenase